MPGRDRRVRERPVPPVVVEILRFCIVLFLAASGYELARGASPGLLHVGPFDNSGSGALLGAAFGYVLGGIVGRGTSRSLQAAEDALLGRSAEQVLAGLVGAAVGVTLGVALGWPLLLLGLKLLTVPVLSFVCVTTGTLGYRVGVARRETLLAIFGPRAGMVTAPTALPALPRIVDSSVAIDGRVLDVVRAGFLHGVLIVPQPVVDELQGLADAGDDTRRSRGRRGLEVLDALRRERGVDLEVVGDEAPEVPEVDAKLVRMTIDRAAALLTLDTNLARAAALAGCRVMNLHALTLALRPPVQAGETVTVVLTRAGKEPGQAVGYLDDGTMVVVERARDRVGHDVCAVVTSVLVTANGRMVFARPEPAEPAEAPRPDPARDEAPGPQSPRPGTAPGRVPTPRDVRRVPHR